MIADAVIFVVLAVGVVFCLRGATTPDPPDRPSGRGIRPGDRAVVRMAVIVMVLWLWAYWPRRKGDA